MIRSPERKCCKSDNYVDKYTENVEIAEIKKCVYKRERGGIKAKASNAHLSMHMQICSQEDLYGTVIASRKTADYFPIN